MSDNNFTNISKAEVDKMINKMGLDKAIKHISSILLDHINEGITYPLTQYSI